MLKKVALTSFCFFKVLNEQHYTRTKTNIQDTSLAYDKKINLQMGTSTCILNKSIPSRKSFKKPT